jgi:hypothetical protein
VLSFGFSASLLCLLGVHPRGAQLGQEWLNFHFRDGVVQGEYFGMGVVDFDLHLRVLGNHPELLEVLLEVSELGHKVEQNYRVCEVVNYVVLESVVVAQDLPEKVVVAVGLRPLHCPPDVVLFCQGQLVEVVPL